LELEEGEIIMKKCGKLLSSFQRKQLENKLTQQDISKLLRQRIEIMILADEGKTQSEICRMLGCSATTAGRWTLFARAQFAHQWEEAPPGRPKKVSDEYIQRLQALFHSDPHDFGYPFRRWTASWLNKHLTKELGIELSDRHLSRLLKQLGLSNRPKEPSDETTETPPEQESRISIRNLKGQSNLELMDISSTPVISIRNDFRFL
jgi:transposase